MRLHVVSDVHGAATPLARAADGADALVCLGDLILFIDYHDHGRGILADLFGEDAVSRYVALRTAGRYDAAREHLDRLWSTIGDARTPGRRREVLVDAVRRQYTELFGALPVPSYMTYGNVDMPDLWPDYLRDGMTLLDGDAAVIGGNAIGFVGGGLVSPMRTPYEVDETTYARKVAAACRAAYATPVGRLDVICTHIPPAVPELTYDVRARRFERGSVALLDAIREHQPRYALFGHVHQPLRARFRIGRTECVNVGHFAARATPYVLDLPTR